jgi:beta-glucosidase
MLHITNKITFGTNLLLYLHYILITNDITNMNHYRNVIIAFAVLLCTNVSAQNGKEYLMRKKAVKIISEMTVDEKINQLMNETPAIEHLGIKPYDWWSEGLHGVGRDGRATVFPQPIGLGATFDPMLVKNIGDAVASEGRAKYNVAQKIKNYSRNAGLTFWSPNVNIFRDPRWGRGMETYGEDPFLTGTLGTAYVQGMQGNDPFYLKVGACGKHFAVHSGPEATRHEADINPTKQDLFETYLPAFKMLVQKGHVETIMGAYNAVYGQSCSGSTYLLTDILRKQWGFKGHIVSDCGAVTDIYEGHKIAKSEAEACAIAIKAGLNLECGNTFKALRQALDQKLLTEKDLDNALLPLMMTRLKLGILQPDSDCPYNHIQESVICSDAHTAIAKQAALESMVLLKNDGILPLDKNIRTLFVAGPGASDAFYLMGNYFGLSNRYCTYLQGIVSKVSNGTSVNYRPAFMQITNELNNMNWAVRESSESEVAIIVMGNNGNMEGEEGEAIASSSRGDRVGISLPESQMNYLRNVKKIKKDKIVVILTGGSPIDVKEISELADAVVMAWYPGQEGGYALGDLIFGDANFSGRLPITFPVSVDKLPAFDNYAMQGRTYKYMKDNIMYPFGYGLSYGHVTYSEANIIGKIKKGQPITVEVKLANDGKQSVDEVAQVYLSAPNAGISSPVEKLVAFKRVSIQPESSATVKIDIPAEQLSTTTEDGNAKLLKGKYTITISGAAPGKRTDELGISSSHVDFEI